jgi:Lhr-like helicase
MSGAKPSIPSWRSPIIPRMQQLHALIRQAIGAGEKGNLPTCLDLLHLIEAEALKLVGDLHDAREVLNAGHRAAMQLQDTVDPPRIPPATA